MLQSVTKSVVHSLYEVLKKPVLLCGGGCWQIHMASFVRHLVILSNNIFVQFFVFVPEIFSKLCSEKVLTLFTLLKKQTNKGVKMWWLMKSRLLGDNWSLDESIDSMVYFIDMHVL